MILCYLLIFVYFCVAWELSQRWRKNHFSFQSFDILCVRGRSLSTAHDLVFAIQRKYLFIKFSFCTGDENIPKREGIRVEFVWHFGNQHLYDKNVILATYIVQIDSGTPQMIIYVNIFFFPNKNYWTRKHTLKLLKSFKTVETCILSQSAYIWATTYQWLAEIERWVCLIDFLSGTQEYAFNRITNLEMSYWFQRHGITLSFFI